MYDYYLDGYRWRPEGDDDVLLDHPERALTIGGVARKP